MGPKKYIVVKDENNNVILSTTNDLKGVMYLYFAYKMSQKCDLKTRIYNTLLFKYIFIKFDLLDKYPNNENVSDFYRSVEKMYHYHGLNNTNTYKEYEKLLSSFSFHYKNELGEEKKGEKENPYKNQNDFKPPKILYCYMKDNENNTELVPFYMCEITEHKLLDIYYDLENKTNDVNKNIIISDFTEKFISILEMDDAITENASLVEHIKRTILRKRDIYRGKQVGYREIQNELTKNLVYKISDKKSVRNDPSMFADYLFSSKETTYDPAFLNSLKELFKESIMDEESKFSLLLIRLEILLYENGYYNLLEALKNIKDSYKENVLKEVLTNRFTKYFNKDNGFDGPQRKHQD